MLIELRVENLVIVRSAVLAPGAGLSVITGETGAGKSLLLDAIDLVSGARTRPDLIGPWGPSAVVTAAVQANPRRQGIIESTCGVAAVDGQFILRRRIGAKSQAWINDTPVTVSALRAAADLLIALHAQHEPIRLADPAVQMELLDAYGNLGELAASYRELHASCRAVEESLRAIEHGERSSVKELDFLTFQLQEIESFAPKSGELAELETRYELLSSADQWRDTAARTADELQEGDQALIPRIGKILRRLDGAPDGRLQMAAESLRQGLEHLREAAVATGAAADAIVGDPQALRAAEERINRYQALIRKHGDGEDSLMAAWRELQVKVVELSGLDQRRDQLRLEATQLRTRRAETGGELARRRSGAFTGLAKEIHGHLGELAMPKARVELIQAETEPTALGTVRQEFQVCTNPGSRAGSIRDVASGGEAARLMLAISAALAEVDDVPVVIYDEVDSGIGGRLGAVVGGKLARMASNRTVIAVTHTPQLAAHGTHHFHVKKHQGDGETQVTVEVMDGMRRRDELAEMLGGGHGAVVQADALLQGKS